MAKDEKKTITVNDQTHNLEDLTEQQVAMVNHLQDLERKISNARFNVDQLSVGREAFIRLLEESLSQVEVAAE
jgi:septal ring factor EnvC (AmiA/AmiB activator)